MHFQFFTLQFCQEGQDMPTGRQETFFFAVFQKSMKIHENPTIWFRNYTITTVSQYIVNKPFGQSMKVHPKSMKTAIKTSPRKRSIILYRSFYTLFKEGKMEFPPSEGGEGKNKDINYFGGM
jgi:hypothetical protein